MHLWHQDDGARQLVMNEPRGCPAMCHNTVLPPCDSDTDAGLATCSSRAWVAAREPRTHLKLDTPAGLVAVDMDFSGHEATSIAFHNVPTWVYALGVEINVPDLGPIKVDVAWGGGHDLLHHRRHQAGRRDQEGERAEARGAQ